MENPCSVFLRVTEIAPTVLSVRLACSLNLDPVDSRCFAQKFLLLAVPANRYSVRYLYDETVLAIARDGILFAADRDLVSRDEISFDLDIPTGVVRFLFTPVAERDVISAPGCLNIGFRGTFTFEPNDESKNESKEA